MKTVPLIGEIDLDMLHKLVLYTHKIKETPLNIILATGGGDFYAALGIFDYIRRLPIHVTITVCGPCFSSGMIILQAADLRVSEPNGQFLIHFGQAEIESINDMDQNKNMTQLMGELLSIRKDNKKKFKEWFNTQTYYNAEQALKHGLIDKVNT